MSSSEMTLGFPLSADVPITASVVTLDHVALFAWKYPVPGDAIVVVVEYCQEKEAG